MAELFLEPNVLITIVIVVAVVAFGLLFKIT